MQTRRVRDFRTVSRYTRQSDCNRQLPSHIFYGYKVTSHRSEVSRSKEACNISVLFQPKPCSHAAFATATGTCPDLHTIMLHSPSPLPHPRNSHGKQLYPSMNQRDPSSVFISATHNPNYPLHAESLLQLRLRLPAGWPHSRSEMDTRGTPPSTGASHTSPLNCNPQHHTSLASSPERDY